MYTRLTYSRMCGNRIPCPLGVRNYLKNYFFHIYTSDILLYMCGNGIHCLLEVRNYLNNYCVMHKGLTPVYECKTHPSHPWG